VQPYPIVDVAPIAKPAGGSLHLLDQPVCPLGTGVGDAGSQEDQNRRPPLRHRLGECGHLGHIDSGAPVVEPEQPLAHVVSLPAAGGGGKQRLQLLLGDPGGKQLAGRVAVDAAVSRPGDRPR
jgi:hypothetical protein